MFSRSVLFLLFALSACSGGGGGEGDTELDASIANDAELTIDGGPDSIPRIEASACRYEFPDIGLFEGSDYDCGDLIVYENRDVPSTTIRVHYARIRSSASSGNATIYLDGGPGGNGSGILSRIAILGQDFLQGLLIDGDFLIIGQRGTSFSVPFLDCGSASECSELSGSITSYNTGYNADDVDDLRATLGYEKLNLYGISYGSRLGLEVLRRHGENVRSAVLGGLVPAHVIWPAGIPASFYSALTALDSSCSDAGACGVAYGDLESQFISGVYSLSEAPLSFNYQGDNITIDGGVYAGLLFQLLYSKGAYPYLPMVIHDLAEGRTDRIESFIGSVLTRSRGGLAYGLYYSVVCGELFNPPDTSAFETANANVPEDIRNIYSGSWFSLLSTCEDWPSGNFQTPLSQPVISDVPTLVASGSQDPITPPNYGEIASEGLRNSTVVVYENSGHGATLQTPCGNQTLLDFLAAPNQPLDSSCASTISTDYILPASIVSLSDPILPTKKLLLELSAVPLPPAMRIQLNAAVRRRAL